MKLTRKTSFFLAGGALVAVLLIVGLILLMRGCSREDPAPAGPDKEAEYGAFLTCGCFDTPEEGQLAAASWLGYFSVKEDEARIAETEAIIQAFRQMQEFFSRDFPSGRSFRSQTAFMGKRFIDSPYPVVRNSWQVISAKALQSRE